MMKSDRIAEASPLLLTPSSSTTTSNNPFFPPPLSPLSIIPTDQDQDQKTYDRSVLGFYLFSIASEVWVITTGTLFLPVVLETYARSNGRLGPSYELPCPASNFSGESEERCAVKILFSWLDTASFSLIVYSTSVALQALTVISIGVLADDPRIRHRLLMSFATLGSLSSLLFIVLPSSTVVWPLCALLAVVANVSFGVTGVCLNSYLPSLVRLSPQVSSAQKSFESCLENYRNLVHHNRHVSSSSSPTTTTQIEEASNSLTQATSNYSSLKSLETSKISSRAIGIGYATGISVLVVIMLPLVNSLNRFEEEEKRGGGGGGAGEEMVVVVDQTFPLRVAIAVSGVWWLTNSLVASRFLGPNLYSKQSTPSIRHHDHTSREGLIVSVKKSWRGLGKTLKEWKRLPNTFIFLSAWFLLSDSFATLTSTAMLYAKTTLNLPTPSLIIVAILTPLSGIFGSLLFPFLQSNHYLPPSFSSNHSILILLILFSTLIPIWGLISLNSSSELYLLSILFGTVYGSFQSFSRTCFSELIPSKRQSGRWFGLYSITDKSSSFLGPLLVSIITNLTGQIRHGFYLILIFFVLAIPMLLKVDMERGNQDAEEFEKQLELEEEEEIRKSKFSLDGDDDDDDEFYNRDEEEEEDFQT
ncbi:hypothetical protein JCM5350_005635 [Sporobolomyces pararoseus]